MDAKRAVETLFSQPQKCYGHCDQSAALRFLDEGSPLVACYSCPAGYVSKIMVYGKNGAGEALKAYVGAALGGAPLKDEYIRTATRHPWDLGVAGLEMRVAYWTQNYRGSKSDDPDRPGLFICSSCGSTYVKPITAQGTTCAKCKA